MRRATRAAWSAAYYLLAITPLRAAVTVQLESGFWTDESASANSGYDIPVSGSLEARGRIYNNRIRYLGEVRAGSKDYFRDEKVAIVREGYFEAPLWGGDVSIGRLLLSWGRADQVNPTDSLVTRDYQWRTVTDEEQKTGNDGISWSIDRADWRYTMIWLPNLRSSTIPWIEKLENVPSDNLGDSDNFAVRVDHTIPKLDWGVSLYQGTDLMPSLQSTVTADPNFRWKNYRIRRFGFDAALNIGRSTLRLEFAQTTELSTRDDDVTVLYGVPGDDIKLVMGVDGDVARNLNLNLQVIGQWVTGNFPSIGSLPAGFQSLIEIQRLLNQQPEKHLYGFTWRLHKKLWQDALELELKGIAYTKSQGGLWSPRIKYKVDDRTTIIVGGDRYYGDDDSIFGVLEDNSVWFLQGQWAI